MIQLLRGTKSQLDSYQTVIAEGQPVFEKDTGQLKIGNGSAIYSALPYVGASSESGRIQLQGDTNNYTLQLGSSICYRYLCKPVAEWTDYAGRSLDPEGSQYAWYDISGGSRLIWSLAYKSGSRDNSIRLNVSEVTSGMAAVYSVQASGTSYYVLDGNFNNPDPGEIPNNISISVYAMVTMASTMGSNWSIAVGVLGSM